jgi:hypothetical protein
MPEQNLTTSPAVRYEDIPGFPGYRVGEDGSVWSCIILGGPKPRAGDTWHKLNPKTDRDGYLQVKLGGQTRKVHRLVLEAFVGPCPVGLECRHDPDRDPANNRVENLCWGTSKENGEDMIRHGTTAKGDQNGSAVLTEADVLEILMMRRAGKSFRAIARWLGVGKSTIGAILEGRTWRHITGYHRG